MTDANYSEETGILPERENGSGKSNNSSGSPRGKLDGIAQKQECNGTLVESGSGKTSMKEEQQQNVDMKVASKPAGEV